MSSKTSENTVNSEDEAKTPAKMNAFQFMMNSRHKVIGSNSPGKEKKDVELKSPEMTEKIKEKHSKRKTVFEDWAEKKGGTKRKLLDEAAEKHINKTLHKRAKRLKKMLDIIDEELKNSGEEGSDSEEVVIKVKTKKRRKPLFIDSDNSSIADDINGSESEKVSSENVKENGDDKEQNKTGSEDELEINTPGVDEKENIQNNEEDGQQSKEATKKKYLKYNGQENVEKKVTKEQFKKTSVENIEKNNCENNGKENNKTPEINLVKNGKTETNSGKKKIRKRSLSLRKTKDIEKNPTSHKNKLDNSQENNAVDQLSDEEIFPTKKLEAIKKSRQLKVINDSTLNTKKNEDVKKECFSPRAWRMKLKAVNNTEDTDKNLESKDSDNENSKDNEIEKETDENQESVSMKDTIEVDDSPQKQVTQQELGNSSGELNTSGSETKKQIKLAPIFLKQKSKKVDKNVLNAKMSFLHSGMPSKVKKLMTKSKSFQEPEYTLNTFPQISHIQQRAADESLNTFWKLPEASLHLTERESNTKLLFDRIYIGSFTNCKSIDINLNTDSHHAPPLKNRNLKEIVKEIKKEHPSYPVYKSFRLLYQKYEKHIYKPEPKIEEPPKTETPKPKRGRPRKKKEIKPTEPEKPEPVKLDQASKSPRLELQVWTEKYKPQSQEDIIGNTTSVQELKSWLESWIKYSEDQKSSRKRRRSDSSDDFCSDSTTKDSDSLPQNLILLFGPLGSGKTCSVYGLCNELSINVIEINASSKRTGKKILADLQEATQSHQVKNTDSKSVNSFFQKKPDSQNDDDVNKKLSLLLFEDVDIVFEDQDDNFISAIATLVTSSKRPIILTYTDMKCWYLQKFILQYSVISFNTLTSRILGPWLQILCLVEGVKADKDMIDKLVQWNKGDVRKIILQLQFWTQTGGDLQIKSDLVENTSSNTSERSTEEEICVDDESPDILWMTTEDNCDTQDKNSNFCHQNCAESFIPYYERDKEGFKLSYPVNLEVLWWNIPDILGQNTNNFLTNKNIKTKDGEVVTNCNSKNIDGKSSLEELNTTVNLFESLALADVAQTRLKTEHYDEPIYNYWQVNPVNSLSLTENFSMYNEENHTSLEITHWVVETSVKQCQNLRDIKNIKIGVNNTVPYFDEVSWRSKRHKCMKDLLSAVPTFTILDRRAICEDYQTILRSINRTEHERSVSNSKRKNRFYHYFKNFSIHLNDSTYLLLCNTLAINNVD